MYARRAASKLGFCLCKEDEGQVTKAGSCIRLARGVFRSQKVTLPPSPTSIENPTTGRAKRLVHPSKAIVAFFLKYSENLFVQNKSLKRPRYPKTQRDPNT